MTASEDSLSDNRERASRIRWAAMAAVLAGLLLGGTLVLRPLLDVDADTPANTVLALFAALGRLLFAASLVGVHLVYGHAYGAIGRVLVWAIVIAALVSLFSLLFNFGVLERDSALSPIIQVGGVIFLLVSILGIVLWMAGATRWVATLLVLVFPVGIVFGALEAVPVLTPFVGVVVGLAYIGLGLDLWQKVDTASP